MTWSVDRLTSDTGRVSGYALNEMLALDLGPQVRPRHSPGAYVAHFRGLRGSATQGKGILMVELKVPACD